MKVFLFFFAHYPHELKSFPSHITLPFFLPLIYYDRGETVGHFLEFTSEIVSSTIAFLFCIDNKFIADQEISTILYGSPQLQLHDKTTQQQQQQLSTLV